MEPFDRDEALIAELCAMRPAPGRAFAAELDQRAAAGFPRRRSGRRSALATLGGRLPSLTRRRLVFAGAGGMLVALAVAVLVISGTASRETVQSEAISAPAPHGATSSSGAGTPGGPFARASAGREAAPTTVFSPEPTVIPGEVGKVSSSVAAANASHRSIERNAQVDLLADPSDVDSDSAKVFSTVHELGGIVLRSNTVEGRNASAHFELLIPGAKLSEALDAISQIDRVRSRREASADITASTVGTSDRLKASEARIDSLLGQLAAAETESEREAVEAELTRERRRAMTLRQHLAFLNSRTNFARLDVRIDTGRESSGGAWGIDDALHDAGRILATAAGVLLIVLAVLVPIALLAALAWLAHRAWLRRARRRALG